MITNLFDGIKKQQDKEKELRMLKLELEFAHNIITDLLIEGSTAYFIEQIKRIETLEQENIKLRKKLEEMK